MRHLRRGSRRSIRRRRGQFGSSSGSFMVVGRAGEVSAFGWPLPADVAPEAGRRGGRCSGDSRAGRPLARLEESTTNFAELRACCLPNQHRRFPATIFGRVLAEGSVCRCWVPPRNPNICARPHSIPPDLRVKRWYRAPKRTVKDFAPCVPVLRETSRFWPNVDRRRAQLLRQVFRCCGRG